MDTNDVRTNTALRPEMTIALGADAMWHRNVLAHRAVVIPTASP